MNQLRSYPNYKYTILAILSLLLISSVYGQGAISVQPPALLFTLQPGESVSQTLRIDNPSTGTLAVRVYPEDWQYNSNGDIDYFPAGTLPTSAVPWLTFNPATTELEPQASGEVRYTLSVPPGTAPGTYWGMLFVEGENPNATAEVPVASFRIRTGHTFYVNVPPLESTGVITGIFSTPPTSPHGAIEFIVQYQNTGNAMQIFSGKLEVRTLQGEVVGTIEIDKTIALPNSTRIIRPKLFGPLPAGDYLTLVVLHDEGDLQDVAGQYQFTLETALGTPGIPALQQAEDTASSDNPEQSTTQEASEPDSESP